MNLLGFNRFDLRLLINLLRMNIRDRYLGSSLGSLNLSESSIRNELDLFLKSKYQVQKQHWIMLFG